MKRILLFFAGLSFLFSCEYINGPTTVEKDITTEYLLNGNLDVYLSNNQVFRYKGKPGTVTIPIGNSDLSKYEACFVLHVTTGITSATTVSSAIIKLDVFDVLNTSDFSKNAGQFTFEICNLTPTSEITVEVRGELGSYIDIWIEGKLKSNIPLNGLIAFYPLDGNANDISGYENNGTIYGGVISSIDRKNNSDKAMFFDGSGYILVPNSPSLQSPTNAITISSWLKIHDFPGLPAVGIVVKSNTTNYGQYGINYQSWCSPSIIAFTYARGYQGSCIPTSLNLSEWYFIALTYDGNNIITYINGVPIGSAPSNDLMVPDDNPLTIGLDTPGDTEYLKGELDNIRIYNRALSPDEILVLYNE